MERALTRRTADEVRAVIARALVQAEGDGRLGNVTLRPHQRVAVARLREMLGEHGGALLADDVGLGKTYVALALTRDARQPAVVCPAALVPMWRQACERAGARPTLLTYETLSREREPTVTPDLLVLDEAHHARTPGTRRYARLAALARRARVLLLTATPIHNRRGELSALFALFLGARAWILGESELALFTVRREHDALEDDALPAVTAATVLDAGDDADTVRAILALPAPLPPRDGGDGGALLALSLVRQWASSAAALEAALRRRVARADALAMALEQGRHPSRAELSAWAYAEDSVQLAFPELMSDLCAGDDAELLRSVRDCARATRSLLGRVASATAIDDARADRLREIRRRHPGEKIIAFAQHTATVHAYFKRLRADGGVAALTARGGLVAGGKLTRRDVLARFAPRAAGVTPPNRAERSDLLLTTDLLSEGVNVQDASVVVHLDLPWTPARMEQRVGRSRRLGAAHRRTSVYALAPPAAAAEMARVEERLRAKLREAARAIGATGAILPGVSCATSSGDSSVAAHEALLAHVARWWRDAAPVMERGATAIAGVRAARTGAIALVRDEERAILLGVDGAGQPTDDPRRVLPLVRQADGDEGAADAQEAERVIGLVERWLARRRAASVSGAERSISGTPRRAAIRRIARIAARVPNHRRAVLLPLAARARQAVTASYGIGAERVLAELAAAPMPDDAWLRAVSAFGETHARVARTASSESDGRPIAVLLLSAEGN